MEDSIVKYFLTSALVLVGAYPLVKWQVNFLLKKTEKLEKEVEKHERDINATKIEFSDKLLQVFTKHSESQNNVLLKVTESHNEALDKMSDKFTQSFKDIAKINVQSEDYLDKKINGVYEEIKGVKEGQVSLVTSFKQDLHNLELKLISNGKSNV